MEIIGQTAMGTVKRRPYELKGGRRTTSRNTRRIKTEWLILLTGLLLSQLQVMVMVRAETVPSRRLAGEQETTSRQQLNDRWHEAHLRGNERRRLATLQIGAIGHDYDVEEHKGGGAEGGAPEESKLREADAATPPEWDSTLCMLHWGLPELQTKPDPRGYIIFVNGREQLGGNKNLVSDGLFAAKSLGRTFVEYPVKNARVWTYSESVLGLGAYWDLDELCMYHRILDLRAFRGMVASEAIRADEIATVRSDAHESFFMHVHDEHDVVKRFRPYESAKVIVMESTWRSDLDREALLFLRPNPFYKGVVRMLLAEQPDWDVGNFLAVQWRTETSTGNITECYQELKSVVDHQLDALGLGKHQVLFNTDLYGQASGTYRESDKRRALGVIEAINADYPKALDNHLHHFIDEAEDGGVRAFVSGLAVASARVLVTSSLNDHDTGMIPEAQRCQKPYSGYVHLIRAWRDEFTHKPSDSTIRMWPFELEH